MHIVILSREIPPIGGGAGAVAIQHAQRLAARGHRVELITSSMPAADGHASPEVPDVPGLHVHVVPVQRRGLHTTRYPEMLRYIIGANRVLRGLVRTAAIDVIHAHAILPDAVPTLLVSRSIRVTATAHGSDVPGFNRQRFRLAHVALRPLWHATSRRIDVVSAPSEFLIGLLLRLRTRERVRLIPNAVDVTDDFASTSRRRRMLVVAARLDPRKRVHLILEALEGISEPLTLHVMGDGSERQALTDLAARSCPQHDITFHGWVRNRSPEWFRLMSEASVSISMSSVENSPVALLEAQLAEHVVIATDIPGHRTVVHPGGRFIASSSSALREAIERVMASDENLLSQERFAGREFVTAGFNWDVVLDQYEEIHRGPETEKH